MNESAELPAVVSVFKVVKSLLHGLRWLTNLRRRVSHSFNFRSYLYQLVPSYAR